jgi:cytochrome c-type biogenesis protein CcmE
MKTSHIIILVVIAAAFGIIVSMVGSFSSKETFETAAKKPGKEYQIIAKLDTLNNAMEYDPIQDPNRFVFYATDEAGQTQKVIFTGAKPQDFERSEQLTMTGKMEGETFKCREILMKCPSKYNTDQIAIGT